MSILDALNEKDVYINGIEFGEDEILINFQEKHDIADTAVLTKQMVILCNTEERQTVYLELQEALIELVDDGYLSLRNTEY